MASESKGRSPAKPAIKLAKSGWARARASRFAKASFRNLVLEFIAKSVDGTAFAVGTGSSRACRCRWAPYSQDHDPGQGQLPVSTLRPLGITNLTHEAVPVRLGA